MGQYWSWLLLAARKNMDIILSSLKRILNIRRIFSIARCYLSGTNPSSAQRLHMLAHWRLDLPFGQVGRLIAISSVIIETHAWGTILKIIVVSYLLLVILLGILRVSAALLLLHREQSRLISRVAVLVIDVTFGPLRRRCDWTYISHVPTGGTIHFNNG